MSGVGIENVPPVHFESSDVKKSTNSGKNAGTLGSAGRKSLQTLQPSGKNRTLLVSSLLALGITMLFVQIGSITYFFQSPFVSIFLLDR